MIESRIKRLRKAQSPDITLSTQILLSCDTLDYGCLGVFILSYYIGLTNKCVKMDKKK